MARRKYVAVSLMLVSFLAAAGKDKKKIILPVDVLQARTILVVVDPDAGMVIEDPNGNRNARADVEQALMKWGRYEMVMDASNADLIITVRKGYGKMAQPTIGGVPINGRPVVLQPTDSGGRAGGRQGNAPDPGDPSNAQYPSGPPAARSEAGPSQDMFAVYRGGRDNPLQSSPVWRYSAKNALEAPAVQAVEEFRKVVAEAEKQQAAQP